MAIHFFSEEVAYQIRHKNKLKRWLEHTAQAEKKVLSDLNIVLCTDAYLHKINVEYLDHDTYTDIITFDYSEDGRISGELFISLERIRENARTAKTTIPNELHRVIIHGLLHLCGYTDKSATSKAEMTQKEDYYLSLRDF